MGPTGLGQGVGRNRRVVVEHRRTEPGCHRTHRGVRRKEPEELGCRKEQDFHHMELGCHRNRTEAGGRKRAVARRHRGIHKQVAGVGHMGAVDRRRNVVRVAVAGCTGLEADTGLGGNRPGLGRTRLHWSLQTPP